MFGFVKVRESLSPVRGRKNHITAFGARLIVVVPKERSSRMHDALLDISVHLSATLFPIYELTPHALHRRP